MSVLQTQSYPFFLNLIVDRRIDDGLVRPETRSYEPPTFVDNDTYVTVAATAYAFPSEAAEVTPFDITSFAPEPYRLLRPMKASVARKGCEYIASQLESNVHASGDSEFEAQENLRSAILDLFEILTEEPEENLAPKALRQLLVLREHIEHI